MQAKVDIGNPRARTHAPGPTAAGSAHTAAPATPRQTLRATKTSLFRRWWPVGLLVVCSLVIGTLAYGYITAKRQLAGLANNGQTAAQNETTQLVTQIGEHIALPSGTPTIATVEDVSKLQSQEFFKNARNGDKVLVYPQAGRALLYRPSTGKVIEYSKINLNTPSNP